MACAVKRGRSRLEEYLNDPNDLVLPAHLARHSRLPGTTPCPLHEDDWIRQGTSMLLQNSSATSYNSLPGLSSLASTETPAGSAASSVGGWCLDQRLKLLDITDGGAAVLPRARSILLECPFGFLACSQRFQSYEDWYTHSLTHFGGIDPPHHNQCCFCDKKFYASRGKESWRQRSEHVAMHHQMGHSLAHARVDFNLYQYLWRERLVSSADLVSGLRGLLPVLDASFHHSITDQ